MTGKDMVAMAVVVAALAITPAWSAEPGNQAGPGGESDLRELTAAYGELEQALKRLPRDQFDPQAIIEEVGRDADALFLWVRDRTDLLPYRGALRGPVGVLMDRGGNSLDRALLLAQLLESAGYQVRLANAVLPDDRARQLLSRVERAHQGAGDDSSATDEVKAARRRVLQHAEALLSALGNVASAPGEAEVSARAAALADHWWVQRQAGGSWVDLDPTGPEARPGQSVAPPRRTVPLTLTGGKLPLEAADCHEVELRIVIEAWRGDQLKTATVLHHVLRPAQTLERSLRFGHVAAQAGEVNEAEASGAAGRQKLKEGLIRQEVYLPALWIDERPITEASFTTTGAVDPNPKLDQAGKLAGGMRKALGGFSQLGGGEPNARDSGVLTAEWIEYEVRIPGEPALVLRREVFDLIGPAARAAGIRNAPTLTDADRLRRALFLTGQTRILLQPCQLLPMFLQNRLARSSLKQKPVWLAMARGDLNTREQFARAVDALGVPDSVTPGFAIARDGISPAAGRVFLDRPNIIHHRLWFEEAPDGEIAAREGMDLAFTSTAGVGADAFKSRLIQGVADTLAEHLVFGTRAAAGESTVSVFSAAAKDVEPVVVRPGDAPAVSRLDLSANGRARALADLTAGQVLVLTGSEPGRWTWWRIDPRTGQTVGVMENGFNSAMSDRASLEAYLNNMTSNLLRRVTVDELKNMSKAEMMKLAQGNHYWFTELVQTQQAIWGLAARSLIRLGGGF